MSNTTKLLFSEGAATLAPESSRVTKSKPSGKRQFRVASLFAGIGGFEEGLRACGRFKPVFASEIDRYARQTYRENFGFDPQGDILAIKPESIPEHDILTGGFPCQAFSNMGEKGGYTDPRGSLAFAVPRILAGKRPLAALLENVAAFTTHDKGKSLAVFKKAVEDAGYIVHFKVLDASAFGIPQHRQRVYFACLRADLGETGFTFPEGTDAVAGINGILEPNVDKKYWLSPKYWQGLQARTARNAEKGNGFGYAVIQPDQPANTLVVGGSGRERNLVVDRSRSRGAKTNAAHLRRLTPRECARLQGFPDTFRIPVSNAQAYRQFGNAVAVPVVRAIADRLVLALDVAAAAYEFQLLAA